MMVTKKSPPLIFCMSYIKITSLGYFVSDVHHTILIFIGGLMSIFLMGVYDPHTEKWCTVSKCGSGFDDKTLEKLQKDFDMIKISKVCGSR